MKKIFLIFIVGISLLFTSCGMSDKINVLKKAVVIEKESGSIKSILNHPFLGKVDEIATLYIKSLSLKKEDFKIKVKTLDAEIYILKYKYRKQEIEFTIYFDDEDYLYVPTYFVKATNQKLMDEILEDLKNEI